MTPLTKITDETELEYYKKKLRTEFETNVRMQSQNIGLWIRYAQWEARLGEFRRARSVFERAIEIDYKNVSIWLKYAEMEMSNKFINHA